MSTLTPRQAAVRTISTASPVLNRINFKETPLKDLFGVNVFNEEEQTRPPPEAGFQGPAEDDQTGGAN